MALSRAHSSIKETIRVAITSIQRQRSQQWWQSDQQKTALIFNRDNFNFFYLRDAVSAVLSTATCLAGWLSVTHAGIV